MPINQSSNNIVGSDIVQFQQRIGCSPKIHAAIGSLVIMLLTTVQLMFQNDDTSPFTTHALIMRLFVVVIFTYTTVAVAVMILQAHCSNYLPVLNHLGLVLGAFVCDFLLLILFPPFGYFVLSLCILMLLMVLLHSYKNIFELICCVVTLAFNMLRDLPLLQQCFRGSNLPTQSHASAAAEQAGRCTLHDTALQDSTEKQNFCGESGEMEEIAAELTAV